MQSHAPQEAAADAVDLTRQGKSDELTQSAEDVATEELPFNAPLSHELFLSSSLLSNAGDFDASAFLLTRKHVSLDDLRSELRTYLQLLRSQLISIINNDYEDFINLGGSHLLGSEDQMSLRMRRPLEGISREIKECKMSLEELRDELKGKMKRRELVRQRKLVCRKLLGVNDQVMKVEEMLFISNHTLAGSNSGLYPSLGDTQDGSNTSLTSGSALVARSNSRRVSPSMAKKVDRSMGSDTKRLERIAQEYNQLLYLVRKSQGLKFVESLQPRIDRISTTLQQDLSSLLSSTLTSLHNSPSTNSNALTSTKHAHLNDHKSKLEALTDLFRTYASINKFREAEEVVRKLLVTDFMARTIHREALLGPQSPLMPITPCTGNGSSSTPSAGGMFGSLGQAFSQASPTVSSSSPSSYPFPAPQNSTPALSQTFTAAVRASSTLSNDERSLIPPFYLVEPVSPPPSHTESDTYISDALIELYNKILVFVSKELGYILEITERRPSQGRLNPSLSGTEANMASSGFIDRDTIPGSPTTKERNLYSNQSSGKAGYEILSNVVWSEIAKRLMNECGHLIFAAGRPDTFHRNYLATLSFVERIESLCPNTRYLQILRNNPEYNSFMKRWQLPVYFQLRFREIIGHLESSLTAYAIAPAPSAVQSTPLTMAATEQIYKAISTCWKDDVYLSDLSPRFWRLSLQILSRYKTWLDAHLPDYVVKDAAASVATASTSNNSTAPSSGLNLQRLLPTNPLSTTSLGSRPATPQPQSNSSTDDSTDDSALRQLSIVISDITKLETMIHRLFERTISPKLPKLPASSVLPIEEGEDAPEAALNATLESLTSTVPSLLSQLATILSKRCSEPLRLVRSGASQVRANTSKNNSNAAPEPSYFVPNILRPAKVFLDGHGKVLEESMKRSIMQTLFEDLASRYEAALAKMKKDGDALRRLKKGRQGFQLFGRSTASSAANEEAASAEDEKVRLQMSADVEAFARDAESLGVVLENSEALNGLRTVVREWNK